MIIADTGAFTKRNLEKAAIPPIRSRTAAWASSTCWPSTSREDDRGGQALRPWQQGRAALEEHVDAGPRAVDVRPSARADPRLAEGQVQEKARDRRGQHRGAERRPCLWRDGGDGRAAQAGPCRSGSGRPRPLSHGHRGRSGQSWGLVAGAQAGRTADVLRRYPITPASAMLHHLARGSRTSASPPSRRRTRSPRSAQRSAPAMPAAVGVTSSSGPGIALKTEAIGLAIMTELPLVIVNSQRGGPSTGLPTKTEQSDLYPGGLRPQRRCADAGDRGAQPRRTRSRSRSRPAHRDAVHDAGHAADRRLHRQRRRAVAPARPSDATRAFPARPKVRGPKPGLPGLQARREGRAPVGQARHARPDAPHRRPREARRHRQHLLRPGQPPAHDRPAPGQDPRHRRPDQQVCDQGDDSGDLAGRRLGRTYGPISRAVDNLRRKARRSAHIHLRHIWPLPANLGEVLTASRPCWCPR